MSYFKLQSLPSLCFLNVLQQIVKSDKENCFLTLKALSLTNKAIYHFVNDRKNLASILSFAEAECQIDKEFFAVKLNSMGAREWLWNHIQTSGDCQAYQQIQRIFNVVKQYIITINPNIVSAPYFIPEETQTENVTLNDSESSVSLSTPFGDVLFCNCRLMDVTLIEQINTELKQAFTSLNERPIPKMNKRPVEVIQRIWDLCEREALKLNPTSVDHPYKNAKEICEGLLSLIGRLFRASDLPRGVREYILSRKEDLPFKTHTLASLLELLGYGEFSDSSNEPAQICLQIDGAEHGWERKHQEKMLSIIRLIETTPPVLLSTFQQKFIDTFNDLKTNWKGCQLKQDHPIFQKIDKNDFYFFSKENNFTLSQERELIFTFADALGIGSSIICEWDEGGLQKRLLLGIKKSQFAKVSEKLNLVIKETQKQMDLP